MESEAHVSLPLAVTINDSSGDNSDAEITGSAGTSTVIDRGRVPRGRPWPRGHILKSLTLALASKPQVLENCPVFGSRTALFLNR